MKRLSESSTSVDELREELSNLDPALKKTHALAASLTTELISKRDHAGQMREELLQHQEKVKVIHFSADCYFWRIDRQINKIKLEYLSIFGILE